MESQESRKKGKKTRDDNDTTTLCAWHLHLRGEGETATEPRLNFPMCFQVWECCSAWAPASPGDTQDVLGAFSRNLMHLQKNPETWLTTKVPIRQGCPLAFQMTDKSAPPTPISVVFCYP